MGSCNTLKSFHSHHLRVAQPLLQYRWLLSLVPVDGVAMSQSTHILFMVVCLGLLHDDGG